MTSDDLSQRISQLSRRLESHRAEFISNPTNAPEILSDALENLHASLEDLMVAEKMLKRNNEECAKSAQDCEKFRRVADITYDWEKGNWLGRRISNRDITEHKEMDDELERLASFLTINPNPIIEVNLAGYVHYANPAANKLFPTLTESAPNHPVLTDWFEVMQILLNGGTSTYVRDLLIGDRWYQQSIHLVSNTQRIRIYCLDITERKLAEVALQEANEELQATEEELRQQNDELMRVQSALQESETKYRTIVETSAEGIVIARPKGNYIYANQQMADLLGYQENEILGKSSSDFAFDENRTQVYQAREELLKGNTLHGEFKFRRKDGSPVWTMYNTTPIFNSMGEHIANISIFTDITERKQAEEALRSSHQILNEIINAIPVRVFWKDRNLIYLGCNATFAQDAGFADPKDIVGKDDFQMGWHDQAELYRADDRQVIESSMPKLLIEEPQTTPEGNQITLLTSKIPLRSSDGEIIGVLGTYMDITERKKLENALLESENMYRSIFENTGTATMIIEDNTIISLANSELERFTGYSKEEIEGKISWTEFVVKEDLERMLEQHKLRRIDPNAALSNYEFRAIDRNGNVKDILLRVGIISGTKKSIASLLDITERKQAEEALLESEQRLANIIDFLPDATFVIDSEKKIIAWNRAMEEMTGVNKDNMIGQGDYAYTIPFYGERRKHLLDLIDLDDKELASKYKYVQRKGNTLCAETFTPALYGGKGAYVWATGSPLFDNKGNRIGTIESIKDITEQKRMEKALQESKDYLDKIINSIGDPLFVKDRQHKMTLVNDAACKFFNRTREEILGKTERDLFPTKEEGEITWSKDEDVFSKRIEIINEEIDTVDTHSLITPVTILAKKSLYTDKEGKQFLIGIIRDITDRKQVENRIKTSLQEKEVLLKEVHHRVKNNLQIISALLSLQSSYLTDENIIKIFRDSQNRIKSMALVHENLYRSKDLGKVDFNEYINQLVAHLSQSYGDLAARLDFKVNSENVYLNINTAIPCGMIINELISNSFKHAFPDGRSGEVCIDLSSEDDGFKLVVSDNGVGIKGDINIKDSKTLGFRLIDTLVKQIDGKMSLDTINGTQMRDSF